MTEEPHNQSEDERQEGRPEPPPHRPIEDLPPVMSTGAFGIPIADLEPEDKPAPPPQQHQSGPAGPPPPGAGSPPPPTSAPPPFSPPSPRPGVGGLPSPDQPSSTGLGGPPPMRSGPPSGGPGSFGAPPSAPSGPPSGGPGSFGAPPPVHGGPPAYGGGPTPPGALSAGAPGRDFGSAGSRQFTLASWPQRVGAAVIDYIIVAVIAFILLFIFGLIAGASAAADDSGVVAGITGIVGILVLLTISFLYAPIQMSMWNGQTIGHKATSTRIVRADGEKMSFGFALLREPIVKGLLFGFIGALLLLIPLLANYLWPLWDDENRALHDRLLNTRVVND